MEEPTQSPSRKLAIVLSAEALFARYGYDGVTIRQIADEAEVPLALVRYYYGQKHELFHAIFARWAPMLDERLAALREALEGPADDDLLERIIEAFVLPVLRLRASPEGESYGLLVGHELAHVRAETDRVVREFFDPVASAFIQALGVAFPAANQARRAWGFQFSLGSLLHHISDARVGQLSGGHARANDPMAAPLLVAFIVGGLRAALAPKLGMSSDRRLHTSRTRATSKRRRAT